MSAYNSAPAAESRHLRARLDMQGAQVSAHARRSRLHCPLDPVRREFACSHRGRVEQTARHDLDASKRIRGVQDPEGGVVEIAAREQKLVRLVYRGERVGADFQQQELTLCSPMSWSCAQSAVMDSSCE